MAAEVGGEKAESEGEEEGDLPAPVVEVAGCAVDEEDGWGGGWALVEVEDGEGRVGGEVEVGHFGGGGGAVMRSDACSMALEICWRSSGVSET